MKPDSPAFITVVYEHSAAFIGRDPWEVSSAAELMADAHPAAARAYCCLDRDLLGIDIYNVMTAVYAA